MKNKKLFSSISTALVFGTVFAASFGIAHALQIKGVESASFNIGAAPVEVKTKVYYQSSFFFGGEATVYAYAWNSGDTSQKNAEYPGVAMTAEDYKHGLYSYEVSDKYDTIIFNAGDLTTDPTKTTDLTIDRTNVYYSQHLSEWKSSKDDCTFSYYMVGIINGVEDWSTKAYENGLLKNYAGNNVNEYLKADYTFKKSDSFKVVDNGGNWYGVGGSTSGGNYGVLMNNSTSKDAFVYFTPNSNLYSGVDFFYKRQTASEGNKFWCHNWPYGGSGTQWPGNEMTQVNQDYWYSSNVPLCHDCIIFDNKGQGGSNNMQTADLTNIDYAKPYFNQTWQSSM